MNKKNLALSLGLLLMASLIIMSMSSVAYDRSESEYCGSCHANPAQATIVDEWEASGHANTNHGYNANTYCAHCMSPFQADPAATHSDNDPVPADEWEGVTCAACHPSHHDRVEWGTPIGNYDVETGEHFPVALEDANDLCTYCHSGSRHEVTFQGYGQIMDKKGVRCIDCHMPDIHEEGYDYESHTWHPTAENSCGIGDENCHENKDVDWAQKQMDKAKIHGKA